MKRLKKIKQSAGGYKFYITNENGNVKLGEGKQNAILNALEDSDTEGVYEKQNKEIIRLILNGNVQHLILDNEDRKYYFE
jgi:hypothetical protein